jgi:hypothetical protein
MSGAKYIFPAVPLRGKMEQFYSLLVRRRQSFQVECIYFVTVYFKIVFNIIRLSMSGFPNRALLLKVYGPNYMIPHLPHAY